MLKYFLGFLLVASTVHATNIPTGLTVTTQAADHSAVLLWHDDPTAAQWYIYLDGVNTYQPLRVNTTGIGTQRQFVLQSIPRFSVITLTMKAISNGVASADSAPIIIPCCLPAPSLGSVDQGAPGSQPWPVSDTRVAKAIETLNASLGAPSQTQTFTFSPTISLTPSVSKTPSISPTFTMSPTPALTNTPACGGIGNPCYQQYTITLTWTISPTTSLTYTTSPTPTASPTFSMSPTPTATEPIVNPCYLPGKVLDGGVNGGGGQIFDSVDKSGFYVCPNTAGIFLKFDYSGNRIDTINYPSFSYTFQGTQVPSGFLYVVGGVLGVDKVVKFSSTGSHIADITLNYNGGNYAPGIVSDQYGNYYVGGADSGHLTIEKFDPTDTSVAHEIDTDPSAVYTEAITLDPNNGPNGVIYAPTDVTHPFIRVYDLKTLAFLYNIDPAWSTNAMYWNSVSVDTLTGNLLIADFNLGRIHVATKGGTFIKDIDMDSSSTMTGVAYIPEIQSVADLRFDGASKGQVRLFPHCDLIPSPTPSVEIPCYVELSTISSPIPGGGQNIFDSSDGTGFYYCNNGGNKFIKLSYSGITLTTIFTDSGSPAYEGCQAKDGSIYILDSVNRVSKYDATGAFQTDFTLSYNAGNYAESAATDQYSNVFVSGLDTAGGSIEKFDPSGTSLAHIIDADVGSFEDTIVFDPNIGPHGVLLVSSFLADVAITQQVRVYDANDLHFMYAFGTEAFNSQGYSYPSSIAVDPGSGNILVADYHFSDTNPSGVFIFTQSGVFLRRLDGGFNYNRNITSCVRVFKNGLTYIFDLDSAPEIHVWKSCGDLATLHQDALRATSPSWFLASLTLTAGSAWQTPISLSLTAGSPAIINPFGLADYEITITNQGGSSGYWWIDNLSTDPAWTGNILKAGDTKIIEHRNYNDIFHYSNMGAGSSIQVRGK